MGNNPVPLQKPGLSATALPELSIITSEREWARIEKHFRVSYKKGGRPPKYSKREILEAIFYVLRTI